MLTRSIEIEQYQIWLAVPPDFRPKGLVTEDNFCVMHRVTPDDLRVWRLQPGFWDGVHGHLRHIIGDALPDIYRALTSKAKQGNINAIKLCLQQLGVYVERTESTVNIKSGPLVIEYSPETDAGGKPK